MTDKRYLKPTPLRKGDKVGIFVPASPVKEPYRGEGLKKLEELGYVPVEVSRVLSRTKCDYLARSPEENIDDMRRFFNDNEIKALWAGRGGCGSYLLLPLLQQLEVPAPKMVIGSSDISYLLWYFLDRLHMVVFYGPMVYSALAEGRFDRDNLGKILGGGYEEINIPGGVLAPGIVRGIVTGGCLSNFVSLLGTPYLPEVEKRVLLLEDVGERPYRLDRMFWQIAAAGIFAKIGGLLLGGFPNCFKDAKEKENFLQRVRHYLEPYHLPIIYDLPLGHGDNIHTLPLGIEVEIDTARFHGFTVNFF
jgi:muramoyltetrapeptide carboxypeptidase